MPDQTPALPDPPWLDALLADISDGTSLAAHCRKPGTPGLRTVYDWCEEREDIAARLARARKVCAQHLLRQIQVIAAGPTTPSGEYDRESDDSVRVARDRLKIETTRWLAGVYDPVDLGDDRHRRHPGSINVTVITGVPDATSERRKLIVEAAEEPGDGKATGDDGE